MNNPWSKRNDKSDFENWKEWMTYIDGRFGLAFNSHQYKILYQMCTHDPEGYELLKQLREKALRKEEIRRL